MEKLKNKIVCLGFIEKGTGKHMSNSVYSKYGIAPTVMARDYKGFGSSLIPSNMVIEIYD